MSTQFDPIVRNGRELKVPVVVSHHKVVGSDGLPHDAAPHPRPGRVLRRVPG